MIYNIIYHADDLDGHASGAIAKHHLLTNNCLEDDIIKMWPFSYGMEFPKEIKENEDVIILDFSFKNMLNLYKKFGDNLTWIDHHKIINDPNFQENIWGYRVTYFSACYLAWKYFNIVDKTPEWVQLLSDYDTWNQSDLEKWDNVILPFQFGMQLEKTDPKENWEFWQNIFDNYTNDSFSANDMVTYYINRGDSIIDYLNIQTEDILKRKAAIRPFEGYSTIITNIFTVPPNILEQIEKFSPIKIDLLVNYQNILGEYWKIDLRSSTIDVSEIAKKYGGGGHKGAAGFIWDKNIEDLFK